ncbi:hypothetical protein O181_050278 [Austropuccinia psidii MF-1]|uniref:Uncharacterized protein n=1 Tax=Austropuccinia psidii MF-1 TaxID=1389203 RepID=A0A9Q3HM78_9BASI|nr:hypothetical protein [Austropuccinia psidii MF-1]
MTTIRGSQYSIQSDGAGLEGRIDPSKGKRKAKIPSGTGSTQGSALSQRKVPEMCLISEPELELSMSNSNRYKSHPEGSDRDLHEPLQAWRKVRYSNGWKPLSSKPQIKKIKEYHDKKKEATKEEAPVAPTSKPQEGKKNKKKNWRKPYSPSYRIPKIQKDAMENFFNMARTLMEFKDEEEERMIQPHFPNK